VEIKPYAIGDLSSDLVSAAPFTNGRGDPHPFENAIGVEWPANGVLTSAERRAWNLQPLASTDIGRILHPQEVAAALHATLEDSALGAPQRWDVGTTTLGEWWTLRARYPHPDSRHPAGEPVETVITTRHAICAPGVTVEAGLRLPRTGAEINAYSCLCVLRKGRITLPGNRGDLMTALTQQARATGAVLSSWTHEALLRAALASWAGTVAVPVFGHSTAATLVALYDRRRFSSAEPPGERPAPMDTACDVAWTVADHLRSVPDIEARTGQQKRIVEAVSELCWWNEKGENAGAYAESIH
jgi:hypothetical protein